jgi:hypothetical protein
VASHQAEAPQVVFSAPPARPLSYLEVRRIITGMMLAMFLAALNQAIVATALPTIGRDFGMTVGSVCSRPPECRHEPAVALDGGADGIAVMARIIAQAGHHQTGHPNGALILES